MQRLAARCMVVVAVVVVVSACTPPPVAAFEDFYQATARKDVVACRKLLCLPAAQALAGAGDDDLLRAFALTRVVQHIVVQEQDSEHALLEVVDATGQHTGVALQPSPEQKTGWCIAGLATKGPP